MAVSVEVLLGNDRVLPPSGDPRLDQAWAERVAVLVEELQIEIECNQRPSEAALPLRLALMAVTVETWVL